MTEAIERAGRFTRDTLVPVSLLITICAMVWFLASDRSKAWATIDTHTESIKVLQQEQREVLRSLQRIEIKLGTKP